MHSDRAVQTVPTGLTLIVDDDVNINDAAGCGSPASESVDTIITPCEKGRNQGVRRHLAQYGDQQAVNDDLALGWDCGICFETAEEPCVTRCGHLYCQAHLHHWLAAHPSCPVCKTVCTPVADVVPIFSRGRTSPASSVPSSPDGTESPSYFSAPTPSPTPPSPPPPPDVFSLAASRLHRPLAVSPSGDFDFDMFPLSPPGRILSSPASSPVQALALASTPVPDRASGTSFPLSPWHAPRRPHPLVASQMITHSLGLALRVLALAIFLAVLLR